MEEDDYPQRDIMRESMEEGSSRRIPRRRQRDGIVTKGQMRQFVSKNIQTVNYSCRAAPATPVKRKEKANDDDLVEDIELFSSNKDETSKKCLNEEAEEVKEDVPIARFTKEEDNQCGICLVQFDEGEPLKALGCNTEGQQMHVFHEECIT